MNKIALIMRGIPGSGKSTFNKILNKMAYERGINISIHSNDDKFMVDGKYVFVGDNLYRYHMQTFGEFKKSLELGIGVVAIDNTNLRASEYKPYVSVSVDNGYNVVAVRFVPSNVEDHFARQVHGVPLDKLTTMRNTLIASGPTIGVDKEYVIEPTKFSVDYLTDIVNSIFESI